MQLMNKCIYYANRGQPFKILSANYFENQDGVIFVEAYKLDDVREVIQGIKNCY